MRAVAEEIVRLGRRYEWCGDRQETARRVWTAINYVLGAPAAVLAAYSGVLTLDAGALHTAAGVLAFVAAGLSALLTFLNPGRRASEAATRAHEYWAIAQQARLHMAADLSHANRAEARAYLVRMQEVERAATKPVTS